jgi:uncharacterized protein (DUF488 family)
MNEIATVGYEGASIEDFDATLAAAKIEVLVDVRAVAVSRRKGFSKTALATRMEASGRSYLHLRDLGDPKPGRLAARAGDLEKFREIFAAHIETPAAQDALRSLVSLSASKRVALLCYEAAAGACHRAIVAEQVARIENLSILHLHVEDGAAWNDRARTRYRIGQGMAAA